MLVVTFMLKEPINIDDLSSFQNFSFERHYREEGVDKASTIGCKIRGVRSNDIIAGNGRVLKAYKFIVWLYLFEKI